MTQLPIVTLEGCAFCAIGQGKDDSAEIVVQHANWIAFFPDNPATPGHTLVIPRSHVVDLWQVDLPLGADLMAAVVHVGRAVERALEPDGMNLITSAGKTAEQSVFHLHLHIVPRWRRDGFGQIWPAGDKFEDADLGDVAERIRKEAVLSAGS